MNIQEAIEIINNHNETKNIVKIYIDVFPDEIFYGWSTFSGTGHMENEEELIQEATNIINKTVVIVTEKDWQRDCIIIGYHVRNAYGSKTIHGSFKTKEEAEKFIKLKTFW